MQVNGSKCELICSCSSSQGLLLSITMFAWCTFCKEPNFLHVALSFSKKHFPKSLSRALKQLEFMKYINVPSSMLNADSSTWLMGWRNQDRFSHPTIILSHKWMGFFSLQPLMIHYALVVFRAMLCFLNTFISVYYPQTFNHPWLNFQSTLSSLVHVIACFRLGFLQEIVLRQSDKFGQPLMEASLGIIDCWYFHAVHIFISGW